MKSKRTTFKTQNISKMADMLNFIGSNRQNYNKYWI